MSLLEDFITNLLANLPSELIGLAIGLAMTWWIVENALEKRRLRKARPIAKSALDARLYHFARFLIIAKLGLLEESDEELKKKILDFDEHLFVVVFEETEKLMEVYGHLIPENIQGDLVDFGEKAGYFADAILHIKWNYEIMDQLEEWKELRQDLTNLLNLFDNLVARLVEEGLLSRDFAEHWKVMKKTPRKRHSS